MVCGVWRSAQLEQPEQSLGDTGQCGPQRGDDVSGACGPPQGARENLVQQRGGDNLVDTLFEGLQERGSLKIMDELRRVCRGGPSRGGKDRRRSKWSVPNFHNEMFPDAAARERGGRTDTSKR